MLTSEPGRRATGSVEACAHLLADLGHAGDALAQAAGRGDVVGALAAAHETRRLRAELARHPLPDPTTAEDIATMRALVAAGRSAAEIVDRWRARPLPPAPTLVATALGVACLTDQILPTTWDVTRDLVVLIGVGLEPVAEMLADLGQLRVIAVVPVDTSVYPPSVTVVADADEAGGMVRSMNPCPPERVVVRSLDGAEPMLATSIADAIHTALCDLRVHHNTIAAFSHTWLDQGVANLRSIARWPSIEAVGDRFAGVPMIICAPGPSLAGNVAQLRAMRGRAIVVGFSHSLRPLRAAGVVPDLVITVDPQDVRYHFRPGDLAGVAAMINGVTVHPSLWQMGAARYLSLASNGALDHWLYQGLEGAADVPGGGSVATTALSLGLRWKCDPIVMVGLDLSFPGGRYYVDTSCDGEARAVVDDQGRVRVAGWSDGFRAMKAAGGPAAARERTIELPGWSGGTVPSSFMFAMFHRWFVETARREAGAARLFNCTEGGCFIEGMRHVPLATVLAELTRPIDVAAALDGALGEVDPVARGGAASRWRTRTVGDLRRAVRLARAGVVLASRRGATAVQRLPRIERALGTILARHDFIGMLAQREIDAAFDEARRTATEDEYLQATAALLAAAARTAAQVCAALDGNRGGHGG